MVRRRGLRQVCGSRIWQNSSRWLRAHARCSQKPLFFLFPTFWLLSRSPKGATSQRSDNNKSLFASVFTVVSRPFLTWPSTASLATSSICPDLQNNYFSSMIWGKKEEGERLREKFFCRFHFPHFSIKPCRMWSKGLRNEAHYTRKVVESYCLWKIFTPVSKPSETCHVVQLSPCRGTREQVIT